MWPHDPKPLCNRSDRPNSLGNCDDENKSKTIAKCEQKIGETHQEPCSGSLSATSSGLEPEVPKPRATEREIGAPNPADRFAINCKKNAIASKTIQANQLVAKQTR
jgi:hypothetical protein